MATRGDPCLEALADWLGTEWTPRQRGQFEALGAWLVSEGIELGGLGAKEAPRMWRRHVCDALVFGRDLGDRSTLLDVGSGVGLPGIPLAIAFPGVEVTLVERSGRRCDALFRLREILDLAVEVRHEDVARLQGPFDRLVFRASLRIQEAVVTAHRLMAPDGGDAWFGLGRGPSPDALIRWREAPPNRHGLRIEEVHLPAGILDSEVWLLRMTRP